jgi:uncharacterized membrane protein
MPEDLQSRIESMYRQDRVWCWAFVLALWATLIFVYFAVTAIVADGPIVIALIVSGALLLLFNTTSITSLVRHYTKEKDFIYGLDIRHLDDMRARAAKPPAE